MQAFSLQTTLLTVDPDTESVLFLPKSPYSIKMRCLRGSHQLTKSLHLNERR